MTGGPSVERRRVSVLFVDLVGFTDLATKLDPEEVRELQSTYFGRAREVVERYGGTVEKFIGDAVMAVWGAPTSNEDDAERAVRAGLDLMTMIPQLPWPQPLRARAGVATGEAAVTFGGDGQALISGETVNLAARLQASAEPGSIRTDDATRQASAAAIVFENSGNRQLKGFDQPITTWRADRVVAGRAGSGRTGELEAPFVGRAADLGLLKDLFHATARERRLRAVSITGQAGIGKSRLAWEFEKYLDGITEAVYWHQGRSPAYGEGITFWALGEMVRRRAGILEGDDDATTIRKVREMLATYVADEAERDRLRPAMDALLGLPFDTDWERGQLFGAWRTLFERVAEQGPIVLVFEDLQWADGGLLDFIGHLLDWSRSQPIFVVTLARPELIERFPTWGAGQRNFTSVHLEPLPDDDMRALLAGLVPGLPKKTVRAILSRAEGVPLYAVETVRMLVADGRLIREGEAYRVEGSLEQLSIPGSLHALVAARLDALGSVDRSLLQQATVLGSSFSIDALAAISGQPAEALQPTLDRLVARDMLRIETDPRSPERGQYQFVQAVIREVAYQTLTRKDRKERHLAAARYFESLDDEELAGALARHYLDAWRAAGEGAEADALAAQARIALRGAAERAVNLHSYDQASAFLKLALDVAVDEGEQAILLEKAGEAARSAARIEDADGLLRRAIDIHRRRGDVVGEGRAVERLGFQLVSTGRLDEALALIEPVAEKVAGAEDGERVAVMLRGQLARAHYLRGDHDVAIALADEAIAVAERLDVLYTLVDALITKGSAVTSVRPREGWAILFGAIQLADRYGLVGPSFRARNNLSATIQQDDPETSHALAMESLEIARRLGHRDDVLWFATQIAFGMLERGETESAEKLIIEHETDDLPELIQLFILGGRAWLETIRGRHEGIADWFEKMERIAASITTPEYVSTVHFTKAGFAEQTGDYEGAARELHTATSMSPPGDVGGRCWYGRVLLQAGRVEEALEVYRVAMAAPARGRRLDADRAQLAAALAAVDGDPGASRMYLDVIDRMREMGLLLVATMAQIEFVRLVGPADPLARAAAAEARETCRARGWNGLLNRLEQTFEDSAPAAAAPAGEGPAVRVGSRPAD